MRLRAGKTVRLNLKQGYTASLYLLKGKVVINGAEAASETELVVLDREGDEISIRASSDTTFFVMNGQPIEEPVVGYSPFVLNTSHEERRDLRVHVAMWRDHETDTNGIPSDASEPSAGASAVATD